MESNCNDFAVGLKHGTICAVIEVSKGGAYFAPDAEGRVKRTVSITTRQQKVGIRRLGIGVTHGHNFTVRLDQNAVAFCK